MFNVQRISSGQVGVTPGRVALFTSDNLASVTAAGYLTNNTAAGFLSDLDVVEAIYNWTAGSGGKYGIFQVSQTNGVNTLVQWVDGANVLLPVVDGDFAVFNGTSGQIKDGGYKPSNASDTNLVTAHGSITHLNIPFFNDTNGTIADSGATPSNALAFFAMCAGSQTIGHIPKFGDANGSLVNGFTPSSAQTYAVTSAGSLTSGHMPQLNDANGTIGDSGIVAAQVLSVTGQGFNSPDSNANIVSFDVTVSQSDLASGRSKTLYTSSGSKQYKIRSLQLNGFGTNFSGGGGDRLGQVTDGTTVYSLVPAATMQSLANARWGDTAIPFPASVAINTSTVAGASLVFKYQGGSADYTAGSLVISGTLQRIA